MAVSSELEDRINNWAGDAVKYPVPFDVILRWSKMPDEVRSGTGIGFSRAVGRASIQFARQELFELGDEVRTVETAISNVLFREIAKQGILIANAREFSAEVVPESPYNVFRHERQHFEFNETCADNSPGIALTLAGEHEGKCVQYHLNGVTQGIGLSARDLALSCSEPDVLADDDIRLARLMAELSRSQDIRDIVEARIARRRRFGDGGHRQFISDVFQDFNGDWNR